MADIFRASSLAAVQESALCQCPLAPVMLHDKTTFLLCQAGLAGGPGPKGSCLGFSPSQASLSRVLQVFVSSSFDAYFNVLEEFFQSAFKGFGLDFSSYLSEVFYVALICV